MAETINEITSENALISEDTLARRRALDTHHSFIVQAPAGSGKTALLTQRFLALLATVKHLPEECLALTFTRKAAAEMRDRILQALSEAKDDLESEESRKKSEKNEYEHLTLELAKKVLARDKAENWELLLNPNRLKIQTLDALCASIVAKMPLSSKINVDAKILDDPKPYYHLAAKRLLQHLETEENWSQAVRDLVLHLDNNLLLTQKLLAEILAHREQWLPHIVAIEKGESGRKILEQSLKWVIEDNLTKVYKYCPQDQKPLWLRLLKFSKMNLNPEQGFEQISYEQLSHESDPKSGLQFWLEWADLIFTEENLVRKTVTQRQGFPAASTANNAEEKQYFKEMKDNMLAVLQDLEHYPEFCEALAMLRVCPPMFYSEAQWKILDALLKVLPVLTAELICIFQENNCLDFAEIAITASRLLGESQNPSEIALGFDYRIQHLLVDEFQDTSIAQYNFLEKLTQGWQKEDERTVFFVGDPQQSIYRFRQAEVGIFLKVKENGFGEKTVFPLYLSSNFRSCRQIIDWVNHYFSNRFPKTEDPTLGAIPYRLSHYRSINNDSEQDETNEEAVKIQLVSEENEAESIVRYLEALNLQGSVNESMALLVRSRSHLQRILPILRAQGIVFQGVELESLRNSQVIQDLLSLTRSVLHLGDRIAWLAILRGPCFQFSLHDLESIANFDPSLPIFWALENFQLIEKLSEEARSKLQGLLPFLQTAILQLGKQTIHQIIQKLWLQLAGDQYVDEKGREESELFFEILENLSFEELYYGDKLLEKLDALYVKSAICNMMTLHRMPVLQVMTIHKAKGLEFDTVILAGVGRRTRGELERLLLWKEMTGPVKNDSYLFLAPIRSLTAKEDSIYQYLKLQQKRSAEYEAQRLLYVAATRAKKRLLFLKNRD